MPLTKECISNMSTIELANGQKIEGCHKKAYPTCKGNRMKENVLATGSIIQNQLGKGRKKQRITETQSFLCFLDGHHFGKREPHDRYYKRYYKSGERS